MQVPPDPSDFTSRLRGIALTVRIGAWLGVTLLVALLTGLVSHWSQAPEPWLPFPTAPSWGYRLTQGLHVAAGTAAVPLLLVKLWSVYPRLFAEIRERRRSLAEIGADRVVALLLVSSALFMLVSGLMNSAQWYPWAFTFRRTHYAVAWILTGAVLLHLALKAADIGWARRHALDEDPVPVEGPAPPVSRRSLLRLAGVAAAVGVVVSAASTVPGLRRVAVLGVRSGEGPQGVPVNKSAAAARVAPAATDPSYSLRVSIEGRTRDFTLADLEALPQRTVSLPIACVEGWSASAEWTGVRVLDLLDATLGAPAAESVPHLRVTSLQPSGPYRRTRLQSQFVGHPDTLVALRLHGERLSLDHGFPCRLIAPNRPGVLQTKWLASLEAVS